MGTVRPWRSPGSRRSSTRRLRRRWRPRRTGSPSRAGRCQRGGARTGSSPAWSRPTGTVRCGSRSSARNRPAGCTSTCTPTTWTGRSSRRRGLGARDARHRAGLRRRPVTRRSGLLHRPARQRAAPRAGRLAGWGEPRRPGLPRHPAGVLRPGGGVLVAADAWPHVRGGSPQFDRILPPPGQPLRVLLQRTDDEAAPVRMHLDLASDDREAEVARHVELGGRVVRSTENWTTLLDPSGRAYCVTRRSPGVGHAALIGSERPGAPVRPAGPTRRRSPCPCCGP